MAITTLFFLISFLSDLVAYIYYQKFVDSQKKDFSSLIVAIFAAFLVWFFIFKLQDRGQNLKVFIPLWAGGTAVFGYFVSGLFTKTPVDRLFSFQAIICVLAIGLGIFFLSRLFA